MKTYKASVFGSTGLIGGFLTDILINDPLCEQIVTLTRNEVIINNKKYILDLKWLGQNSKEYQNFNKKLLEVTVNMSKIIRFPQNDISLMVTSVIAVSVNLGDQLLERNDLKPSEVSLFATKLFLKGL